MLVHILRDSPNNVFKDMTSYHGLPGHPDLLANSACLGRAGKATAAVPRYRRINCADAKTMAGSLHRELSHQENRNSSIPSNPWAMSSTGVLELQLIRRGEGKHINSLQSLDDVIHWSPSTIRELGHLVAPTGGEQVADACCKRKNCLPGKPY
ncbi:hypothetical protein TNCV_47361 [Trichonephila clavipes]|nr:hypothetical protein TNCV_47361 [Trichonephila clavipes]